MKINEIVAILLVLASCVVFFYNPMDFSRFEIVALILLSVINWNVTILNAKEVKGE